ncbi:MAG TPA: RNA polymerase sigma factor [Gemmataceae bacterium]|nr:RNA polymerase sigma factor [Gemmataceae bacterium]
MSADPLDTLLEKLAVGDRRAAEEVFLAYEPYLRMVVRRHLSPGLRAKFDSADVVQSVWADVLVGFREAGWQFADAAHLRAFLIRLTRHRFIDRLRKHRRAVEREQSLAGDDGEHLLTAAGPEPADVLAADELWEEMLELCPPEHRELLRLKRQGALNAEVAARTGLHEGSVRRILCTLSRRLARRRGETDPGGAAAR